MKAMFPKPSSTGFCNMPSACLILVSSRLAAVSQYIFKKGHFTKFSCQVAHLLKISHFHLKEKLSQHSNQV